MAYDSNEKRYSKGWVLFTLILMSIASLGIIKCVIKIMQLS